MRVDRYLALLVMFALAACDGGFDYHPPAMPHEALATVTGSKLTTGDFRALVVAVDGKLTGPHSWDQGIAVGPGAHTIKIMIGNFRDAGGAIDAHLLAESGKIYTVRATELKWLNKFCAMSTGWIADDTGSPVTEKVQDPIQVNVPPIVVLMEAGPFAKSLPCPP